MSEFARIPMQLVGPMKLSGTVIEGDFEVPLATYESPLWPSVNRGARVSTHCKGGIHCAVIDERMTRSVLFEAESAEAALGAMNKIKAGFTSLCEIVKTTSRYAELLDLHSQIAGNLLFVRFEFRTGDAAGHNMCTHAAEALMTHILEYHPQLQYGSISGNYCTDKKASAVNGILGRGKYVVAELTVPKRICKRYLKADPDDIVQLNIRKNLVGSILAGGTRSANAHFANMLLGFYLATGQDAANIVEGSQGLTLAEQRKGDLYFSVTIPNLILGTVGNGKGLDFVTENFEKMGLTQERATGENARRLACLCAATVLCGELSLMAAQTNPGELMEAHRRIERGTSN